MKLLEPYIGLRAVERDGSHPLQQCGAGAEGNLASRGPSIWVREQNAPYEMVTKDAEVRWPFRAETRRLLRQTYVRQLAHATTFLKGEPIFTVGIASGTLRIRGDLAAPTTGQTMALDTESLFQHTLVFGGTGEGKTSAVLKPLMRQVLADRKFGAFVADAKGVLWHDVRGIAKKLGRTEDVIVVGTGADAVGINVMASLSPSQVAAVLRSILTQIGGGSGQDNFWPDMAAAVMRHMLTIGRGGGLGTQSVECVEIERELDDVGSGTGAFRVGHQGNPA